MTAPRSTRSSCRRLPIFSIVGLILLVSVLSADPETEYMEFRFHAGLPGNQSGVTPAGRIGAAGAVQMAIPVAYTPAKYGFVIDANTGMSGRSLTLEYHDDEVNGSLSFGLGLLEPGRGLYVSYMATSISNEPVWALQHQLYGRPAEYAPDGKGDTLGIAIGGIDLNNQRASSSSAPRDGDARSFYVVATDQLAAGSDTLYGTLGVGTGRYEGLFGGLCYRPDDRFAVFAEYDSLGVNCGMTYALKDADSRDNFILFLGAAEADTRYTSYGVSYTFVGR